MSVKSAYGTGETQRILTAKVQNPLKGVLNRLASGIVRLRDVFTVLGILREIASLPEPSKEEYRNPGTPIVVGIRDDFFEHLNMSQEYRDIFRSLINFAIAKCDCDNLYDGFARWWFLEMVKRGWPLDGRKKPESKLWHNIRPSIKRRLSEAITSSYQIYQDRQKKLANDLRNYPEELEGQIAIRHQQFIQRILDAMELEVEIWKKSDEKTVVRD